MSRCLYLLVLGNAPATEFERLLRVLFVWPCAVSDRSSLAEAGYAYHFHLTKQQLQPINNASQDVQ